MKNAEWNTVSEMMQGQSAVQLGPYTSYWMQHSPRRTLHYLSYYKFASKLLDKKEHVLDVGCAEGLGTWVLTKETEAQVLGLDLDPELIGIATQNWVDPQLQFECGDFLKRSFSNHYDAFVSFDVIEHILPEHQEKWWQQVTAALQHDGIAIIGTPTEISQQFASEISRRGHVNIYSPERLEKEMKKYFQHVFIFAAHDEVVHTGYMPLAHYQIVVGCQKRESD